MYQGAQGIDSVYKESCQNSPSVATQGPIPRADDIGEIRSPIKKDSSLGLGTIKAPTNGQGRRSGCQ